MNILKSGMRLKSAVCSTEVMVIRGSATESADIRCGGMPMLASHESGAGGQLDTQFSQGALIGKRYVDAKEQTELLCTKGGEGGITINGELLQVKIAKALPSSD